MSERERFCILYVEDSHIEDKQEPADRFADALNRAGFQYALVVRSVEVLERETYDAADYDLIVLEQATPEYRGLELVRTWQAAGETTPVILLAISADPAMARMAREVGVDHMIIKDSADFYLEQIATIVEQVTGVRSFSSDLLKTAQRVQRLNRSLLLLNQVGQLLTSTLELEQVVSRFVETTTKLINTEGSTVWLSDSDNSGYLICAAAYSSGSHVPPNTLRLAPGEGIAGWVAEHDENVLITDPGHDPRFSVHVDNTLKFQTKSLLTVPLRARNAVIGVLQLVNKRRGNFDDDDRTLAETLAASAAIAIENARLIEELRRRNEELQQQNADLDAYSDTVAHDLKNPITHFLSYADDLRENYAIMSADEIEGHLEIVLQQSKRMNSIIEELLLLARVRMTKDLEVDMLDMGAIVDDVLGRLDSEICQHGAYITVSSSWPRALGYAPWVEGVWYNYISNGLKYGGEPPILELGGHASDTVAHFWIKDHGEGLTPDEQAKLFKPFPKLDRPRRKGHGLGLVIVKRIIERLGGQVWVESDFGKGSTFYFSLPHA